MSIPVIIIILLAILLAAWALFRFAGRAPSPPVRTPGPGTDSDAEIRRLLQEGRKIDAIKLVVAGRALGLKEAKDAVEALERTGALPPLGPEATVRVLTPEAVAEITSLAAAGRQIDAIRLYRELTGADLKESKEAVDALVSTR